MNPLIDLGPDHIAADLEDLRAVLALLNQAKKLHDGGHYEAHAIAERARLLLQRVIVEGTE
jgi:hypothetical protein